MIRYCLVLLVSGVLTAFGLVIGTTPASGASSQSGVVLNPEQGVPGTMIRVTPQTRRVSECTAAWDSDPPVFFFCGLDGRDQLGSTTLTAPTTASPGTHAITVCAPSCDSVDPGWKGIASFEVLAVVPDLADHSIAEAGKLLAAAGLTLGKVTGPTDDPNAYVTNQTPKASSAVYAESTVDVVLASVVLQRPPVLVAVPNVLGMLEDDARRLLTDHQLRLLVEPGSGSGSISEQQPAPGTRVPVGRQVSVKLRSNVGTELITVPDVHGLAVADARRVLLAAGLAMAPAAATGGTVTDQLPAPGSRVPHGTTVNLTLSTASSWHPELLAAVMAGTGLLLGLIAAVSALRRTRRRRRRRPQVSVRSDCQTHTVTIRDTGRSATHTAEVITQRHRSITCEANTSEAVTPEKARR